MFNKRSVGNSAEDLACEFLKKKGFKVLDRNFTIRGGEIDIITQKEGVLVFVEVKARYNHSFGTPIESITYFKQRVLLKTGMVYINKIRWGDKAYRFDLVAIDYIEGEPQIEHIENIFS